MELTILAISVLN